MKKPHTLTAATAGVMTTAALATAAYGALVVLNRARYGRPQRAPAGARDSLLDRFIPNPEVAEHHHIEVAAPADLVLDTARNMELLKSPIIAAIIKARELALGGTPDSRPHPTRLIEQMQSIGWGILHERPGREIVMGAVTQPWEAAPIFRTIPADQFLGFDEPGYVKIVWTLRADPIDERRSVFHTETRVSTTDAGARRRFRTYWSFVAPGVELIRLAMLRPLKRDAEARVRASGA